MSSQAIVVNTLMKTNGIASGSQSSRGKEGEAKPQF
jgi:hypothetical protein